MIVHVEKKFDLQNQDGTFTTFIPGFHEVSDEVASHWYVRAHLVGSSPVMPAEGTHEYALMMLDRAAKAKETAAKAAELAAAAETAAKVAADALIDAGGDHGSAPAEKAKKGA